MKRHKLTKRQLEIMKILWSSPHPMIASDIEKCNPTLNINTVQACLRASVKENFIKIADIVYSRTVLTRSYSPVLTKEEYLLDTFEDVFESSSNTLLASLINTRTDPKELDELEKMIARKRVLFTAIMLIFIRMAIPLNFPFTYTLYSYNILPHATKPLTYNIPGSKISILNVLCVIWICGTVIQFYRLILRHIRLRRCLFPFIISRESPYNFLFDIIENYTDNSFEIAVLPLNISPAITGLKKPILILPDIRRLTEQELKYVCAHEIMHYTKHDLWLLLLVDIVCCIHWWNPLVYLMRRRFSLLMEISNDQDVLAALRSPEQIEYAELILKTVKLSMLSSSPDTTALLSFADKDHSDLQTRIKYIFSKPPGTPPSGWVQFCKTALLCVILLFSFFFVTEASFPVTDEELGCVSITPENAYFIKIENRLDLYVDGDFLVSVDTIPDTLENIPVYDTKENLYEEK